MYIKYNVKEKLLKLQFSQQWMRLEKRKDNKEIWVIELMIKDIDHKYNQQLMFSQPHIIMSHHPQQLIKFFLLNK